MPRLFTASTNPCFSRSFGESKRPGNITIKIFEVSLHDAVNLETSSFDFGSGRIPQDASSMAAKALAASPMHFLVLIIDAPISNTAQSDKYENP
jgi:hypothetical protein